MDQLEQRIRRSSRLKDNSTFRQLLAYASLVKDEDQVYSFMEENKIGIQEPEFWVAKLNMLKNRCQYNDFVKLMKSINRNHELKKHPKYWLIVEVQNQLETYLEKMLRKKIKGKRSAREYEVLNLGNIQKETRKFGKIQVYVDPDCRKQYRLEDLVSFVCSRLQDQCQIQKNSYIRQRSDKPLSFIGKAKDKIDKISLQLFKHNIKTEDDCKGRQTNTRLSIVGRKSNKQEVECIQTPDFKRKSLNKSKKKQLNKQNIQNLDSVEILKNFHPKRSSVIEKQEYDNPQFDAHSDISSVKKEKMRDSPHKSQSFISTPDLDKKNDDMFSFAVDKLAWSEQKKENRVSSARYRKNKNLRQDNQQQKNTQPNTNNPNKDFAFIEQTTSQVQFGIKQQKRSINQQSDLQHIIKQIQMQKYQSQTFSQIDSNKQNNILLCQYQQDNHGCQNMELSRVRQKVQNRNKDRERERDRDRKKFETIRKNKEQFHLLANCNDDGHNLGDNADFVEDSSRIVYQELLECLNDGGSVRMSMSEREKKKRISRISQQRSYSFSQTRSRSRRNT